MSNRGFIKYVEKRLRKVLRAGIKVQVRKAGTWNEKGYNGKWQVNYFVLTVWIDDRNQGLWVESSDQELMVIDSLDCLVNSDSLRYWLKRKERT